MYYTATIPLSVKYIATVTYCYKYTGSHVLVNKVHIIAMHHIYLLSEKYFNVTCQNYYCHKLSQHLLHAWMHTFAAVALTHVGQGLW